MTEFSPGRAKARASLAVAHSAFNFIIAGWSCGYDGCLTSGFFPPLLQVTDDYTDAGHDLVSFLVCGTKSVITPLLTDVPFFQQSQRTFLHSLSFTSVPGASLHAFIQF